MPPPPIIAGSKMDDKEPVMNPLAGWSLFLGIASIYLSIITGIVGLVLRILAIMQIRASQGRQRGIGLAVAGIITSIILSIFIASTYYGMLKSVRSKARQTVCMDNQRQMATAIAVYIQDHDGNYPTGDFFALINSPQSSPSNTTILRCPESKLANGYGYNNNLRGNNVKMVADPATTILTADGTGLPFYTSADIAPKRHKYFFIASFVDGHVKAKSAEDKISLEIN